MTQTCDQHWEEVINANLSYKDLHDKTWVSAYIEGIKLGAEGTERLSDALFRLVDDISNKMELMK